LPGCPGTGSPGLDVETFLLGYPKDGASRGGCGDIFAGAPQGRGLPGRMSRIYSPQGGCREPGQYAHFCDIHPRAHVEGPPKKRISLTSTLGWMSGAPHPFVFFCSFFDCVAIVSVNPTKTYISLTFTLGRVSGARPKGAFSETVL